jgi:hypothetical protein
MWKQASTVAFAVRGNWVVAAVKFSSNTPVDTSYTPATFGVSTMAWTVSGEEAGNNKLYILKKCIKKGFNECLLKLELG